MKKIAHVTLGLTSLSASLLGTAVPAEAAAPTIPNCTTLNPLNDTAAGALITAYNLSATSVLKKDAGYKKKAAAVTKAEKAVTAAKKKKGAAKTKALAAANKALKAAKASRDAAINAVTLKLATASVEPNAVAAIAGGNLDETNWNWGTYTARVIVKNKVVKDICVTVDETNAHDDSNPAVSARTEDKATSADTYIDVLVPMLRTEAVASNMNDQSDILGRVAALVTGAGGAAPAASQTRVGYTTIGAGTGSSYTIEGFYNSLQAALLKTNVKA
jgi:hypothetical protein